MKKNPMRPIPIKAAEDIAKTYGYDQVIIVARRVGTNPKANGEHLTTYGITKAHCDIAAKAGAFLADEIFKWHEAEEGKRDLSAEATNLLEDLIQEYRSVDLDHGSMERIVHEAEKLTGYSYDPSKDPGSCPRCTEHPDDCECEPETNC